MTDETVKYWIKEIEKRTKSIKFYTNKNRYDLASDKAHRLENLVKNLQDNLEQLVRIHANDYS